MIRTSESIVKLAAALVAAQSEMKNAPKETKGQVGSQVRFYTDLPTLTDLVRPILAQHGLAYIQLPTGGGNGHVSLTTRIVHESGEWLEDEYQMPAGQGAQGVGSAITYARRYALMAALGIAADDDDGHAASQQPNRQPAKPKPVKDGPSQALTARAMAMFKEADIEDRDDRLQFVSYVTKRDVKSWNALTSKEVDDVLGVLDNLIKGRVQVGYEDDGSMALKEAS